MPQPRPGKAGQNQNDQGNRKCEPGGHGIIVANGMGFQQEDFNRLAVSLTRRRAVLIQSPCFLTGRPCPDEAVIFYGPPHHPNPRKLCAPASKGRLFPIYGQSLYFGKEKIATPNDAPMVYLCTGTACQPPTRDAEAIKRALGRTE
jgi:hypothetical protein